MIVLVGITVVLAAEVTSEGRMRAVFARIPAILLVLLMSMVSVSAQILLVGLAIIAATRSVVDVRNPRSGVLQSNAS
jgi:hypothetical protein